MYAGFGISIICVLVHLDYVFLSEQGKSYDEYSLFRITPKNQSHLDYLSNLSKTTSGEYDFWLLTTSVNHPADVMIAPPVKQGLIRYLNTVKMPFSVLIDNIGEKIKEDKLSSVETPPALEFFAAYQDIEDVSDLIN
ncbi:hypothetical protein JTE90_014353 [Oedothorax gibbosus]|uniref:Zinc carboxypeptidase A 1 n=1 Tax=Oedothorax gibbosus TaxID=931172 RepID=A0AAV6UDN4_9ARAC|nr:hypothetical protein JTE90_014353 [Oedothorax gibbosus]